MGVRLINVPDGGAVVAIARNAEQASDDADDEATDLVEGETGTDEVDEHQTAPMDEPNDEGDAPETDPGTPQEVEP